MPKAVKSALAGLLVLAAIVLGALYLSQGDAQATSITRAVEDGITVEIRSPDGPIEVLRENRFTVVLKDASGQPIRNAKLQMVMFMPKMYCGDFYAQITETAPGVYEAVGVLPMRGKWKAELKIDQGGRTATVSHLFKTE
ncbi:FixH family protein [Cohnella sp. REN36]|uniref:FixH family protein n=1 Tax=Cohnella sp. REN36 TaxID=2887347 RepID=UPI001D14DF03|nr:FixH family protein [Cohnella sp. REN36]MCC3371670.1 FixH family protein [Cohnella sp. REN36]